MAVGDEEDDDLLSQDRAQQSTATSNGINSYYLGVTLVIAAVATLAWYFTLINTVLFSLILVSNAILAYLTVPTKNQLDNVSDSAAVPPLPPAQSAPGYVSSSSQPARKPSYSKEEEEKEEEKDPERYRQSQQSGCTIC